MTAWGSISYSDFPTNQTSHQFHDQDTNTKLEFYRITRGFHRAIAMDVACLLATLTLPDSWFRPMLGLACSLIFETIFPTCHDFLDFLREKTGDLTQFYDKNPYTNRKFEKKPMDNTKTPPKTSITQRLRTVSCSNSNYPTGGVKPI